MRILITCDPEIPVPPGKYGGVERLVSGLCQEYTKMGHEVYLVANPKSEQQNVIKLFGWKSIHSRGLKNVLLNSFQLKEIVKEVKPDVIHSFSRLLYLYPLFLSVKGIPVLQTYGRAISQKSTDLAKLICGDKLNFCCCGKHMLNNISGREHWNVIYNFTDTKFFNIKEKSNRDYFAFLGRIEDIKGTHEAIQVALATDTPLKIAGNIEKEHQAYFDENVKPYLSNPLISYIGPVNDIQKRELLQNAKALLFPIKWEEPFGIVMIEAMACGAPVLAFNRGSVSEVVVENLSGFVVNSIEEMISKSKRIEEINHRDLFKYVNDNFSIETISSIYMNTLERISVRKEQ